MLVVRTCMGGPASVMASSVHRYERLWRGSWGLSFDVPGRLGGQDGYYLDGRPSETKLSHQMESERLSTLDMTPFIVVNER